MKLTKREAQIHELTRELPGMTTKQIAERLGIAVTTAWFHRRNMDLKLARHRGDLIDAPVSEGAD